MMTRVAAGTSSHDSALSSHSYDGFASATAMLTGATGFLYSLAFVVLRSDLLSAVFLVLTGLF
ncbi:MAG: hypothetical protein JOZ81_32575, partial [Chloroflexi bacterium]|nr:hypothetical protein [Chloroflexota bacterium]